MAKNFQHRDNEQTCETCKLASATGPRGSDFHRPRKRHPEQPAEVAERILNNFPVIMDPQSHPCHGTWGPGHQHPFYCDEVRKRGIAAE
ncbi:hypothetical protein ZHAS_00002127 [Anopheles sinensis]|uniref:Uncharacterized protein n=1 Tax=Anopheles sinensis TaxID=74873 RepID=A0A084VBT9_ANOSI|nr:hypothetical protein ZHAS_00002127 [Anopheles sinensis]